MSIDQDSIEFDYELVKQFEDQPQLFVEVMLNRKLSPKQLLFIQKCSSANHIIAMWSRQTGKSTVIASYIVWRLLYGKGSVVNEEHMSEMIIILAPIKEQVDTLWEKIKFLIEKTPFITEFVIKMNSERVLCKNGNQIRFMSASPGAHIRSKTATLIVIDETQDVTDEKYYGDILPFGATTNAQIIEAGTPKTKNHFWKSLTSKDIVIIRQLWFECPFLSKEYIDKQKENSPEALFRQEYMCEFIEEGVLAFPSKYFQEGAAGQKNLASYYIIKNISEVTAELRSIVSLTRSSDSAIYTMGLDLGKEKDPSVVTILRTDKRPVQIVLQIAFPLGTQYFDIAKFLSILYVTYEPVEFNLDYSNEKTFTEILQREGVPIVFDKHMQRGAIQFSARNKEEMINTAQLLFENYEFQLPLSEEKLIAQFMNQQFEVMNGRRKYYHPTNEHDDLLWSTLLALKNVARSGMSEGQRVEFINVWEKYNDNIHPGQDIKFVKSRAENLSRRPFLE